MSDDWPLFYKLGVDPDTGGPGEVDSATEYRRVLATWGAPDGVLDLAGQFRQDTEKALGHKLQRYCEDVFDRDFREHPRAVSLFDRPVFKDPAKRRQALQNLVNRARPMLRQGGLIGTAAAQPPRFAYLGIYTHAQRTPEEQGIIDEIGRIINATAGNQYTLDVHPLDNPYEIYLYFSNYAFAVPSLPAVYGECHNTYTDFYAELMKAPAGSPQASIPLHLSKSWEGKFDDLVVYTDAQARILVEVLSLLLFGSMLRVIHPV
ncbi:MAG: hypothetical protein NTY38_26990, partial [Acidobacteria bacterium]|nr:hypothetical protein [Acidobacteriota bacterium]